eukprot:4525136-Pyramimonas_sp.AAC.1
MMLTFRDHVRKPYCREDVQYSLRGAPHRCISCFMSCRGERLLMSGRLQWRVHGPTKTSDP